jgi:hypothetical protein
MSWISESLRRGTAATAATSAVLAICGARRGDAAGPINAVSHIAWGARAAQKRGVSAKYTGLGFALNAAGVGSWAALHALVFPRRGFWIGGALVSGLAWVTDYLVVPERLAPGFERRLTPAGMLGVYAALAAGLALGSATARR